jgi:hypothetical protein
LPNAETIRTVILTYPTTEEPVSADSAKLVVLLEEALADMLRLQAETEVVSAGKGMSRIATGGIQALRPTLAEGCAALCRRLVALGHPASTLPATPADSDRPTDAGAGAALNAYRPCFVRLGKALREARRLSDEATMAVLSQLIIRLEKHLWLFDLPLAERRAVDWSAVNLFSLC